MRLRAWCESIGISYSTAMRWMRDGQMPVPYTRTATGTILVDAEESVEGRLQRQVDELREENAKLKAAKV